MLSRRLLRIKVVKSLYSHFKSENDSLLVSEKNLFFSIDKTYQLYHLLLYIIVDVCHYGERKIELGKIKMLPSAEELNPNTKFTDNKVIALIAGNDKLLSYLTANKLSWSNYPELIKKIYSKMVASDYYKSYMASGKSSYNEDLKFVINFFTHELEDLEELEEVLEEQSIYWVDDIGFALMMIVRTISEMKSADSELVLPTQYKNDDDRDFAKDLFRNALVNHRKYFEYIDSNTPNWDLERIAFMDRVIMLSAVAELLTFPTIPIKVSLDEFIEISKYYSTPGSSLFINGVLDKIVESLKKEGAINKQGRGLVE